MIGNINELWWDIASTSINKIYITRSSGCSEKPKYLPVKNTVIQELKWKENVSNKCIHVQYVPPVVIRL